METDQIPWILMDWEIPASIFTSTSAALAATRTILVLTSVHWPASIRKPDVWNSRRRNDKSSCESESVYILLIPNQDGGFAWYHSNSMSKCQHWKVGVKSVKCPANDALPPWTRLAWQDGAESQELPSSQSSCCCRAQLLPGSVDATSFWRCTSQSNGKGTLVALVWGCTRCTSTSKMSIYIKILGNMLRKVGWCHIFTTLRALCHGFSVRSGCGSSTQVDFLPNITSFACRHCAAIPIRLKFGNLSSPQQINMNIWMISSNSPTKTTTLGDFDLSI